LCVDTQCVSCVHAARKMQSPRDRDKKGAQGVQPAVLEKGAVCSGWFLQQILDIRGPGVGVG
jgi:hypothetical protein